MLDFMWLCFRTFGRAFQRPFPDQAGRSAESGVDGGASYARDYELYYWSAAPGPSY
jgi:hypothetical protein